MCVKEAYTFLTITDIKIQFSKFKPQTFSLYIFDALYFILIAICSSPYHSLPEATQQQTQTHFANLHPNPRTPQHWLVTMSPWVDTICVGMGERRFHKKNLLIPILVLFGLESNTILSKTIQLRW